MLILDSFLSCQATWTGTGDWEMGMEVPGDDSIMPGPGGHHLHPPTTFNYEGESGSKVPLVRMS